MGYPFEKKIIDVLSSENRLALDDVATSIGVSPDAIRRSVESLISKGYLVKEKMVLFRITPTDELISFLSNGFPEFNVRAGAYVKDLDVISKRVGIPWGIKKGILRVVDGRVKYTVSEEELHKRGKAFIMQVKDLLGFFSSKGNIPSPLNESIPKEFMDTFDELRRRHLLGIDKISEDILVYTGKQYAKDKEGFSLSVPTEDAAIGKFHPITILRDTIRDIFVSLGFKELTGNILESAFWNFDALFQPQDHPARELADTFYVDIPKKIRDLAHANIDKNLISRVKDIHEKKWMYDWDESVSKDWVLRTHTTAVSARYLGEVGEDGKFFSVGRVFRNESTDATHLCEFYQVEGIIVWEKATFRHLLGILKLFYNRMGFDRIRFRPSYFPYTEPSLEIEVFFKDRNEWLEMGGAGIFRPEVTLPLCNKYPVLAWGLSLERPLMLKLGLKDIRDLYKNDVQFLRDTRLRSIRLIR